MCTIIIKDHFVGKNYDSAADTGMMFTNKRGLIKQAAVFPPEKPLEWVSVYGSITFSQSGKEFPVSGINETGLIVEQATLKTAAYPEQGEKPAASSLETTQFLLDTCSSVEQALGTMERFDIVKSSWPVHYALTDCTGAIAVVEFQKGEKRICRNTRGGTLRITNSDYCPGETSLDCRWAEDMFGYLEEARRPETVWSNVYDLGRRKIYVKRPHDREPVVIDLDGFDFSPAGRNQMLDIKSGDTCFRDYREESNCDLVSAFFYHPVISGIMAVADPSAMIGFMAEQPKRYDRCNEVVVRFLSGERIKQLPVKEAHRLLVLKYLASKFEAGKDYTESQVNAVIDDWHTFGDYFILRRGLVDSGLLKRLPNGSKYWREII